MKILTKPTRCEITVLKSIFICDIIPINNENEIKEHLKKIKKEFFDAKHHVYAYILGPKQNIFKCNDDGEPQKTAGYPILNILLKKEITNTLVIVTRYFGGTLLGTGGLVRAYSNACLKAIENSTFIDLIEKRKITVICSYKDYQEILRGNFQIVNSSFTTSVYLEIEIPTSQFEEEINRIKKITNENAIINTSDI